MHRSVKALTETQSTESTTYKNQAYSEYKHSVTFCVRAMLSQTTSTDNGLHQYICAQ